MEKRRTFRQLVSRTCFTIFWQFILCVLLLYIFPLLGFEIKWNGQSVNEGPANVFWNVFSWIYMGIVFLLLTTFHMGRMLRRIKSEMDQVYQSSTWILQDIEKEEYQNGDCPKECCQNEDGNSKQNNRTELTLEEFYRTDEDISKMKERIIQMLESERKQKEDLVLQVAAASHDIKTPLTVIRGNAELLSLSEQDDVYQQYTEDILAADKQLELYVDHLIRYTKTYSEGNEHFVECDIKELAEELSQQTRLLIQGKANHTEYEGGADKNPEPIRFSVDIAEQVRQGTKIMLHREYVVRAVSDLVSIAIAYSVGEEQEIRLSIYIEDNNLCIAVWNANSEVAQDIIEHFGTLFYRGDKARTTQTGHFGIGHAFVKRVAKMHGGDAYIENQGNGVKATICIPIL